MTDDQILEVVQAHKEGKQIQSRLKDEYYRELAWLPLPVGTTVFWNFIKTDYRVAPEPPKPREFWLTPIKYGLCQISDTKTEDALWHVREVID